MRSSVDPEALRAIRMNVRGASDDAARATVALGLLLSSVGRLERVIRPIFELFHQAIAAETLGYFWSDEQGNMLNAFAEQPYFLRADVVMSCMRYQQAAPTNWPSFNENVLVGPVSGYLLPYQTAAFYESSHFAETYAQIGAHHILDAVVHDGRRPYGCVLVMRAMSGGPFSQAEIEQSRRLCDMFLLQRERAPSGVPPTRKTDAGRLVVRRDGQIQYFDPASHQSLWMVTREKGAPPFGEPAESIRTLFERALQDKALETWSTGYSSTQIACPWGDFRIEMFSSGDHLFAGFSQIEPFQAELARRLARSPLTPLKIMICWLLVAGVKRKEIAAMLELGMDTLSEHITAIYKSLEVRSATELVVKLVG